MLSVGNYSGPDHLFAGPGGGAEEVAQGLVLCPEELVELGIAQKAHRMGFILGRVVLERYRG
jgi:hypothetical protein